MPVKTCQVATRHCMPIEVTAQHRFEPVSFEDLLEHHVEYARGIVGKVHPIEHFKKYIQYGYYPCFLENVKSYLQKLAETISLALVSDLPAVHPISYGSIEKMRLLLHIISESVPFKPNVSKLSEHIDVTRHSLINFFRYLEDLRIIQGLYPYGQGNTLMQKPEKIFLHHPNLFFALSGGQADMGSICESSLSIRSARLSLLATQMKETLRWVNILLR